MTKVLVFDSGPLINLSMNGLLYLLEKLKKASNTKFIITLDVKHETIDCPLEIQRFELEALQLKQLMDSKIIELPDSLGISQGELAEKTSSLKNIANNLLYQGNSPIEIVSQSEMSCLALSEILTEKGIENIIAIDERTTRMITENPKNLENIISNKIHQQVKLSNKNITEFKQFKFIRSSELVFVAYKKGLSDIKDKKVLEAMIYATKFKGAAISWDEINVLKKL
jgi:predicted DNA-binding protein (UPF0251 family)